MAQLHQTRCINHASREAVARCPVCKNFFCRECVTEHDGKVVCASCLQASVAETASQLETSNGQPLKMLFGFLRAAVSLFMLWILFYAAGRLLLLFPDSFHNGDMWKGL